MAVIVKDPEGPTDRSHVRRNPSRGHYDRASIDAVLDAVLIAHVAFVDSGQPVCIPFLHARIDDAIYIHGSTASRAMRILGSEAPACVTVTSLDGLVLARSAFDHSANYRSAVLFGSFLRVTEDEQRIAALAAFTNKLLPGKWTEVRGPSSSELKATVVLAMTISESSVKVRTGPPTDDEGPDAVLDIWAGVVPIETRYGLPLPSPRLRPDIPIPPSVDRLLGAD